LILNYKGEIEQEINLSEETDCFCKELVEVY
jgi:hypothetical protein